MYTITQVNTLVKSILGIDATDFKMINRKMYFVDTATGKATLNTAMPDNNTRLSSIIGSADSFTSNADGSLSFYSTLMHGSGSARKKYKRVTTLGLVGTNIVLESYMELFDVLISANLSKNTGAIAQARVQFGLPVADLADVIHAMSTAKSTFIFDPYEFNDENLKVLISVTAGSKPNRSKISGTLIRNGVAINAEKMRWEVWPGEAPFGVPNTTSNRNASAQFPTEPSFEITTDLRDRQAYPIMGQGEVRLVCMATTSETDGDKVQVMKEEIITLSSSVFKYF